MVFEGAIEVDMARNGRFSEEDEEAEVVFEGAIEVDMARRERLSEGYGG